MPLVDHVDQLRAGFEAHAGRKCDTSKASEFSILWFGTRVQHPRRVTSSAEATRRFRIGTVCSSGHGWAPDANVS